MPPRRSRGTGLVVQVTGGTPATWSSSMRPRRSSAGRPTGWSYAPTALRSPPPRQRCVARDRRPGPRSARELWREACGDRTRGTWTDAASSSAWWWPSCRSSTTPSRTAAISWPVWCRWCCWSSWRCSRAAPLRAAGGTSSARWSSSPRSAPSPRCAIRAPCSCRRSTAWLGARHTVHAPTVLVSTVPPVLLGRSVMLVPFLIGFLATAAAAWLALGDPAPSRRSSPLGLALGATIPLGVLVPTLLVPRGTWPPSLLLVGRAAARAVAGESVVRRLRGSWGSVTTVLTVASVSGLALLLVPDDRRVRPRAAEWRGEHPLLSAAARSTMPSEPSATDPAA